MDHGQQSQGGELIVLDALSLVELSDFCTYDQVGLAVIPSDIRGLRHYLVRNLMTGKIGGTEFHRIRKEMVYVMSGSITWISEDTFGAKHSLLLTSDQGVFVPPYILHTYEVMQDNTTLLVVANTLFIPDDTRTHDTYPEAEFRKL